MGQLIMIDEEELNGLKYKAAWTEMLIEDIDKIATGLYPDTKYWCDTGNAATVASAQLCRMAYELEQKRLPLWKKLNM